MYMYMYMQSPWVKLRGKDYETQKRLVEDTKKKYISDSVKKKVFNSEHAFKIMNVTDGRENGMRALTTSIHC